jgi:hypothetical protein
VAMIALGCGLGSAPTRWPRRAARDASRRATPPWRLGRWSPGARLRLNPPRQPAQALVATAAQPGEHGLARHLDLRGHLGQRFASEHCQHRPIALHNNGQLHQHRSRPPAVCRPQTTHSQQAEHGHCHPSGGSPTVMHQDGENVPRSVKAPGWRRASTRGRDALLQTSLRRATRIRDTHSPTSCYDHLTPGLSESLPGLLDLALAAIIERERGELISDLVQPIGSHDDLSSREQAQPSEADHLSVVRLVDAALQWPEVVVATRVANTDRVSARCSGFKAGVHECDECLSRGFPRPSAVLTPA